MARKKSSKIKIRIVKSGSKAWKYAACWEAEAVRKNSCKKYVKKYRVNFGRIKSKVYKDKTDLKLYSHCQSEDLDVRKKYRDKYKEKAKAKNSRYYFELKYLY